jgi:hypothetical protein
MMLRELFAFEVSPNPVEEKKPEKIDVCYAPYGSFGQYNRSIAILKDGTVVDPKEAGIWRGKKLKCATVNKDDVLAIVGDSASSSGWKGFWVKEGKGKIKVESEIKKWVEGNKEFMQPFDYYYYVDEDAGVKVLLKSIGGSRTFRFIGKPKVRIISLPEGLCVEGETYHIKDKIKALGAKWFPEKKCWLFKSRKIPAELADIAEIEYSPDVPVEERVLIPSERAEILKREMSEKIGV